LTPDFIKMDVEGAEVSVLRGLGAALEEFRPTMIIESHTHELADEITSLLRKLSYAVTPVRSRLFHDFRSEDNSWIVAEPN
jgi:hypothetical protein